MPAGAATGEGAGKATVVQRLYMLLEQTTDSRDREESEWPVTSRSGTGAGQPGAGGVPLSAGQTAMERLMSAVSGSLGQVAYETAHVLRMPPTRRSSVPMERLLTPLKTGLQPSLVWTLSTIRGIYGDKIAADVGGGSAGWGGAGAGAGAGRQGFGDFVYMWLGEKHAAQKKSEAARWAMVYGVELFRKDFAEVWLFGKFVREEFMGDELLFLLYSYTVLFEGALLQQPMEESENFMMVSFRMCQKCINTVLFEGASMKKIKTVFEEFEWLKSEK